MPTSATASRIAPYVEQLLEDESARQNLRRGAEKLRDAYERSQKRRVKTARDEKLRGQLKSALQLFGAGTSALVHGVQKPKKRRGRLLRKLLTVGAIGAGVALALNEDLRSSILGFGSGSKDGDGSSS
jgi:hypothetical protein